MNTLDLVLLAPLIYGAYNGFKKGFILEIISVLAFIIAIIGSFGLLHWGVDILSQHFDISGKLLPYVSFILIFIGIVIAVNLIGKLLKKIVDFTLLGPVDKMAGAIVSFLKWAFGLSIIVWLTDSFGLTLLEDWKQDSLLYPYLLPFGPLVVDLFSSLMPFAQDLFESIKEMLQGASSS